jgi:hypothetical protein
VSLGTQAELGDHTPLTHLSARVATVRSEGNAEEPRCSTSTMPCALVEVGARFVKRSNPSEPTGYTSLRRPSSRVSLCSASSACLSSATTSSGRCRFLFVERFERRLHSAPWAVRVTMKEWANESRCSVATHSALGGFGRTRFDRRLSRHDETALR